MTARAIDSISRLRFGVSPFLNSLRLPTALLATLKAQATKANMPTQRLIRMMIEAQLGDRAGVERKAAAGKAGARKAAAHKAARSGKRAA